MLQLDVVKLVDGNVLHILDISTGYQNGFFIQNMDAETTRKMMGRIWIGVYVGAADYIYTDAGINFASSTFKNSAETLRTIVRIARAKAHSRFDLVERGRAYLRTIHDKLRIDIAHIRKEDRLFMSFEAFNDSRASYTGICPKTLVCGVYPKIPGASCQGSKIERVNIIRQCIKLAQNLRMHTLKGSTKIRHTPSMVELNHVRHMPTGHDILVYREKEGWKRYTPVRVRDNEVVVILPNGIIFNFAICSIRPYYSILKDEKRNDK